MSSFVPARGLGELVTQVEGAREALRRAKGAGIEIDGVAIDKLRWLEKGGRDFRAVTPKLQKRMETMFVRELDKVVSGRSKDVERPVRLAVIEYRDAIVDRLEEGGGDVSMTPLKDATVKRKGNSHIGVDSGDLLRRVRRAKVRTVR